MAEMTTYKDANGKKLQTGDRLSWTIGVKKNGERITHEAVYTGDGTVVEYGTPEKEIIWGDPFAENVIREIPLKQFSKEGQRDLFVEERAKNKKKAVEYARARIGETDYNIVNNNCQTFADQALNGGKGNSRNIPDSIEHTAFGEVAGDAFLKAWRVAEMMNGRLTPGGLL